MRLCWASGTTLALEKEQMQGFTYISQNSSSMSERSLRDGVCLYSLKAVPCRDEREHE